MKPFFKWAGGKRKELPIIKKYLPKKINTFYEPFVGGGALWLNLNHKSSIINDKWWEIYNFYNQLKINQSKLVYKLQSIIHKYNKYYFNGITKEQFQNTAGKFYYHYRDSEFTSDLDHAIRFWILRQLSFGGMNRFNKSGKYNVPFGWYKSLRKFTFNQEHIDLFENTTIMNGDFFECVTDVKTNDFVFLDPPYTTKFNKYSPDGGFTNDDHLRLSNWFKNSKSNNMIIINKDEFTYSLYKDYIKEEYDFKYSVKYKDRVSHEDSKSIHILATNYNSINFF
jgi:DNA adenine methylase